LIQSTKLDANDCPDGGLDASGVANACGLERSRPAVNEWQNQFDQEILDTAHETGVPAQLMKNIFSRESQFWPGIFRTYREAGLGQLTDNGADTVLLWNPSFFDQFCPLVFSKDVCKKGFSELDSAEREMLSGALVNKVNAACPDCPAGIDLSQATFSVNVFAQTLLANCEQAGQVIYNATGKAAGLSSSFIDLWRFTLINYNAGAGCLENAVKQTQKDGQTLNWENVSAHLEEFCQGAISYVNDIAALGPLEAATPTVPIPLLVTQVPQTPEVVPTLAPTNAPTPSVQSATPTSQPPAENTPTATPTHSYGYPEPTAGPPIYPYP
jgi:hypothetical protein